MARIRFLLAGFLILGALGVVVLAIGDSDESSAVRRGDFPAFWSLAVIAAGDEPEKLYDIETQRRVQNAAWSSLSGGLLPAAYPAHVAFVLQPLARLDYRVARWVWTGLGVIAMFLAARLCVEVNRRVRWPSWMVFALLLVFTPILRGVLGGQILACVVCLIAIIASCERRGSARAEIVMGAALGALLVKPQYALCALVVPLSQRRWICLVTFVGVAALSWWLGALVLGGNWLGEWVEFSRHFSTLNLETNAHQMPNLWAQVYRLCGAFSVGDGCWWFLVVAYGVLGLAVVSVAGGAGLHGLLKYPRENGTLLLCLVLSLAVITLPYVNFYDLGICACAVLLLFRPENRGERLFVASALFASLFGSMSFGAISSHFLLALAGLFYVCARIRQSAHVTE